MTLLSLWPYSFSSGGGEGAGLVVSLLPPPLLGGNGGFYFQIKLSDFEVSIKGLGDGGISLIWESLLKAFPLRATYIALYPTRRQLARLEM